jgi:twitching motility protein PilU
MHDLLRLMKAKDASDLYIAAGAPPSLKVHGRLEQVSGQKLSPAHTQVLARSIMNDKQAAEFDASNESNFAISLPGVSRYRISAYVQRSSVAMVVRAITAEIPAFEDLHLPPVLKEIAMSKRGMVIFVGATGSGKSTSLAAMIDYRNENSYGHIITIEDPVEYVHSHRGCVVSQREVGTDTANFEVALKNSLRQAPDVILIGVHPACEQHQPGNGSHHQLFPRRPAPAAVDGSVAESSRGYFTATVAPAGRRGT